MSEEKKNNNVSDAVRPQDPMERLRAADKMLSSHKGVASGAHVSESERAARVSEAKDKLRENIERAGNEAAAQRALEYSKSEYRYGIIERENKKAKAARRERERVLAENRLERAKLSETEREEYLARERAENERASRGVVNLLAEMDGKIGRLTSDKTAASASYENEIEDGSANAASQTDVRSNGYDADASLKSKNDLRDG